MSKKEKKKKRHQWPVPTPHKSRAGSAAKMDSPAAELLSAGMLEGGPENAIDILGRIMRECHVLRQEPEFRDLYFDFNKTAEVSARVMAKYDEQMKKMAEASADERQKFYDQVRIEIIDELATPAFRQDVLKRLDRCSERLMNGKNFKRWELALFIRPLLEMKTIPWGLCGLITTTYHATMEEAMRLHDKIGELLGDLVAEAKAGKPIQEVLAKTEDPVWMAEMTKKMKSTPGLYKHMQEQTHQIMREFEQAIRHGEVKIELFTEEEVVRPLQYLAEYIQSNQIDMAGADPKGIAEKFAECAERSLGEIVTPERLEQIKDRVNQMTSEWLAADNPKAALLRIAASHLETEKPAENLFLLSVYMGQIFSWQAAARPEKPTEA